MSENNCNFKCKGVDCPNHCCGAYSGCKQMLSPLENMSFSEIILIPEDVKRLEDAGYKHLICTNEEGLPILYTAPDGTCMALQDGLCSIYDERPAICRAYPLYLDLFVGAGVLKECKAVSDNLKLQDFKDGLSSLLEIYKFWVYYYKNKIFNEED